MSDVGDENVFYRVVVGCVGGGVFCGISVVILSGIVEKKAASAADNNRKESNDY